MKPTAELWTRSSWVSITIDEAVSLHKERRLRCPECYGRVRPHREGVNAMKAHFEHYEAHPGCSLGHCFDGNRRPHRKTCK